MAGILRFGCSHELLSEGLRSLSLQCSHWEGRACSCLYTSGGMSVSPQVGMEVCGKKGMCHLLVHLVTGHGTECGSGCRCVQGRMYLALGRLCLSLDSQCNSRGRGLPYSACISVWRVGGVVFCMQAPSPSRTQLSQLLPAWLAPLVPWWFCLAGPQRDQHPSNQLPRWLQLARSASRCLQLPWKLK